MSERQAQIRDRIARLMGWDDKVGATRDTFEVVQCALGDDCLVVRVGLLEQIASALEGLRRWRELATKLSAAAADVIHDMETRDCDCADTAVFGELVRCIDAVGEGEGKVKP